MPTRAEQATHRIHTIFGSCGHGTRHARGARCEFVKARDEKHQPTRRPFCPPFRDKLAGAHITKLGTDATVASFLGLSSLSQLCGITFAFNAKNP
jgi:hypothetical protein